MTDIENKAYLLVASDFIGVTNDEQDVAEKIKSMPFGSIARLEINTKDILLDKQHAIMCIDSIINSMGTNEYLLPNRQKDYNLVKRHHVQKKQEKLFTITDEEVYGFITGGNVNVE